MEIITTENNRVLRHDGIDYPLPALAGSAVVRLYSVPDGYWLGVQPTGQPKPVYAGRGAVLVGELELEPDEQAVLELAKNERLKYIITQSELASAAITERFSANERLSWTKQEAEAVALLAHPEAAAPLLRGMAAVRGIDVLDLRDRVLANVAAFEQASAQIIGYQQHLEDAVRSAGTVDDVLAVVW